MRTQGTEQRPRPVDETGSAEVVQQHNEISRRKRGAIELMLQTDVVRVQQGEPRRNKLRLFRFFYAKNQSLASLFLLFRKKARSAHLLVCKRTHDGSLSLPPFYEYTFGVVASKTFGYSKKKRQFSIRKLSFLFVLLSFRFSLKNCRFYINYLSQTEK